MDTVISWVLNESSWLPIAMLLSILAVGIQARRQAQQPTNLEGSLNARILSAMHLFYGCMIGIMAFGHLLAVSVKVAQGELQDSWWWLYPIGVALAIPAGGLMLHSWSGQSPFNGLRTVYLNAGLGLFLVALGPHNLPLAVPAALNIAYRFQKWRPVGWAVVTATSAGYLALFVGATLFFLSGQSFEEFRGIE